MKRTNRIVPTYTGDVSGACSALFELGGMVVIHDPSGCNSTYNTHDETRWYDHDSLIFITGLVERDAVLGNDEKLIADVVEAARELSPRFIALCNSPIPFLNGTDFRAICRLVERECGIPCFYVKSNGLHDYVAGAGAALVALADRFVGQDWDKSGRGFCPKWDKSGRDFCPSGDVRVANILGATPLDLGVAGKDASLRAFVQAAGYEVLSCWAMGSTLDELARAGEAAVNLVVSATGLPVAKWLRERFGTPYVVGFPLGGTEEDPLAGAWNGTLAAALAEAEQSGECAWPARDRATGSADGSWALEGEPVFMGSLAAALAGEGAGCARVLCPLEADGELLGPCDAFVEGEEGTQEALAGATDVVADGLYRPIVPEGCRFHRLDHQAFSGRNSWRGAEDLVYLDVTELLGVGE